MGFKTYNRIVKGWQIHHLSFTKEELDRYYVGVKPMILTGTIVMDPTGKFKVGYHFRSTLIREFDEMDGIVHTITKSYKVIGPEGDTILGGDIGNNVMYIYY